MKPISLQQRLKHTDPLFSVEFFPPKSDDAAKGLLTTAATIKEYNPDFVSITYGAGGSTRSRTLKYAKQLAEDYGFSVMPHLTCVGHSKQELTETILEFKALGFNQIMALRGDPPKGQTDFTRHPQGLDHANELVHLITETYPECAIGVAGYPEKHPEAISPEIDLLNLKRKVDAGGTFITTQLFLDNKVYFTFLEDCTRAGIQVPILPGLMCATSLAQAIRFCEMCGTSMPEELKKQLSDAGNDSAKIEAAGVEWAYQQARELLERGAPGIHLYILNRSGPAVALVERLRAAGFYKPSKHPHL